MSDQKITISNGKLNVPENPTVPYIEGDGTGVDIWPASQHVFDQAIEKAYNGSVEDGPQVRAVPIHDVVEASLHPISTLFGFQ